MSRKASFDTLHGRVARHFFEKGGKFTKDDVKREVLTDKTMTQIQNVMSHMQRMTDLYTVETKLVPHNGKMNREMEVISINEKRAAPDTLPDKVARHFYAAGRSFTAEDVKAELFPGKNTASISNIISRLVDMTNAYKVQVKRQMIDGRICRVITVVEVFDEESKEKLMPTSCKSTLMRLALGLPCSN